MELLLDTHVLIWSLFDADELSSFAKEMISNEHNSIFFSISSLWEIEIKHQKHPELMPYSARDIYNLIIDRTDFLMLNIRPEYLFELDGIIKQEIHNDPFDHMILSTAKIEGMKLLSHDKRFEKYKDINLALV